MCHVITARPPIGWHTAGPATATFSLVLQFYLHSPQFHHQPRRGPGSSTDPCCPSQSLVCKSGQEEGAGGGWTTVKSHVFGKQLERAGLWAGVVHNTLRRLVDWTHPAPCLLPPGEGVTQTPHTATVRPPLSDHSRPSEFTSWMYFCLDRDYHSDWTMNV